MITDYCVLRSRVSSFLALPNAPSWVVRECERDRPVDWLPWAGEDWWLKSLVGLHTLPYPAEDTPGKLAYTASEREGLRDRQTVVTPGRYLSRFFPALDSRTVECWAAKFKALHCPARIQFARTPDEIEDVYSRPKGVTSCMQGTADEFASCCHPTRVYGAGDLAIAYLASAADRVDARTLTWPEKRIYLKLYGGEAEQLRSGLEAQGYREGGTGDFAGAKLLRIEHGSTFVMPYLDDGLRWMWGAEGQPCLAEGYSGYCGRNEHGLAGGTCGRCDEPIFEGDYCDGCEHFCDGCGESCDEDALMFSEMFEANYCGDCYSDRIGCCEYCETETARGNMLYSTIHDESYCSDCYSEQVSVRERCDSETGSNERDTVEDAEGEEHNCCPDCRAEIEAPERARIEALHAAPVHLWEGEGGALEVAT